MKQIMFARTFPSYHPRKGEPTYFVEKMLKWYMEHTDTMKDLNIPAYYEATKTNIDTNLFDSLEPKFHTIRAGNRWKEGDTFAPKIWMGKAYHSPTYQFLPPIKVVQTIDVSFYVSKFRNTEIIGIYPADESGPIPLNWIWTNIAKNDGLGNKDFFDWFANEPTFKKTKRLDAQIICWESVDYLDANKDPLRDLFED